MVKIHSPISLSAVWKQVFFRYEKQPWTEELDYCCSFVALTVFPVVEKFCCIFIFTKTKHFKLAQAALKKFKKRSQKLPLNRFL